MKGKILVVDDEWSMRELLKNVLELSGFEVLLAKDDMEFRERVFKDNPDAVILDIMLGEKDGTQVYDQLLAEGLSDRLPVIFLTALAEDRPPVFPKPGRKYALVGKPFDPEKLIAELQDSLAGSAK